MTTYGPTNILSDRVHAEKYRGPGESFRDAMTRIASTLGDSDEHFHRFREILLDMAFMPGGRIQAAIGSLRNTTAYNCFVSGTIEDSYTEGTGSIMARAKEAAVTMRMGGGIGYDFSPLRPKYDIIKKLGSKASGPVSFMEIFDAVCRVTASAGDRRGAQMGILRIDHPDIEEFIRAKTNTSKLTGFNISIAVTDAFMRAVQADAEFELRWGGKAYKAVRALELWKMIMRNTYDWGEPGVIFIDRINTMNNLYYCETIAATNPCGEQPLPPYGACLLGSINLTKYLYRASPSSSWSFDYSQLFSAIPHIIRAMDNVVDVARYPMYEQEVEAKNKRRMGIGITGTANTIEALGHSYGSPKFINHLNAIMSGIKNEAYRASASLAKEKGPFPLFNRDLYLAGKFVSTLDSDVRELIAEHGIRNSHLLSIAPTGTISLAADNVSSGIEPVFAYEVDRIVIGERGAETIKLKDYGYEKLGVQGKVTSECTTDDHLRVLIAASKHVDSAVSKTCNVPRDFDWEAFQDIYMLAWEAGCKGCTTFRDGSLRSGIIKASNADNASNTGEASATEASATGEETVEPEIPTLTSTSTLTSDPTCEIDPITGRRNCE